MKNSKFIFAVFLISVVLSNRAWSVELVCKGYQQQDSSQRRVVVDCESRDEALNYLIAGWKLVKEKRFPEYMEDMCWQAYSNLKQYPPQSYSADMANTFFYQCNQSLNQIN